MPLAIEKQRLLIVEGKDEQGFFHALLKHLQIASIQILPVGGKDKFALEIQSITKLSGFAAIERIGIVRDSDANPKGAFDSVCSALRKVQLPTPPEITDFFRNHATNRCIGAAPITNRLKSYAGRHLPDYLIEEDVAFTCLQDYFACLEKHNIKHHNIKHTDNAIAKARLHAFLASRDEPDLRLGEAAQKGY